MLKISNATLPQSLLSYVAFRVAFRETMACMAFYRRHPSEFAEIFGYLGEVPFLREVPAHVQLDLLVSSWERHMSPENHAANLVDESVIYAACETAARLVESDPARFLDHMRGGPIDLTVPLDNGLSKDLRLLYLELPNDGDFLLVSQFLDMEPSEASEMKIDMGVNEERLQELFDVLGRWHVSPDLISRLNGLLTESEMSAARRLLRDHCDQATHQH